MISDLLDQIYEARTRLQNGFNAEGSAGLFSIFMIKYTKLEPGFKNGFNAEGRAGLFSIFMIKYTKLEPGFKNGFNAEGSTGLFSIFMINYIRSSNPASKWLQSRRQHWPIFDLHDQIYEARTRLQNGFNALKAALAFFRSS